MATIKSISKLVVDGDWIESKDQSSEGIRLIQTGNIGVGEYLDKSNRAKYISEETLQRLNCTELYAGDILISRLPDPIGRACVVPDNVGRAITAVDCTIVRLDNELCSAEYFVQYTQSELYQNKLSQFFAGSTRTRISRKNLEQIEIPLPDMSKQKYIASELGAVDKLISLRKQQLAKLDELVKSRFVELFDNPVSNPLSWEKRTLKEVCVKLNDGTHFSPESYKTGQYKYVTAKNIKLSGFDFSNITYVPEEVHRPIYERCNPEMGDVLYIKDGATTGIAMVNTLEEEFTLLSSVALLKQDRSIMNGYFLTALLNNDDMYTDIRNNMGGAAITRLTIAKLNAIKVIVPPIELQNQFAAFVKQTDKSKLTLQQSLAKLELLKEALMQKYFG